MTTERAATPETTTPDLMLLDRPDVQLNHEAARGYVDQGLWRPIGLEEYLFDAADARPDHRAIVGLEHSTGRRRELSYSDYAQACKALTAGLRSIGVDTGTRVSVLLPNVIEFAVTIFSTFAIGAVYSGIPVTSGPREAGFILRRTRTRVLVTSSQYRGRDLIALLAEVVDDCPDLESVIVVDPPGPLPSGGRVRWMSYDDIAKPRSAATADLPRRSMSVADLAHVGFTSGTTGEPKGVMNTHATLDAVLSGWIDHLGPGMLDRDTVNLIGSPIGHHTGFLWGVLLSARLQGTAVLVDRWDAQQALATMQSEGVTLMLGAPTFLRDLLDAGATRSLLGSLRLISIPGAPIPRGLVRQAQDALECFICPAWGMTEYGIGLSAAPGDAPDEIVTTDGAPVGACEVMIVDTDVQPLGPGIEGDLLIRGPGLFLGYLDRPDFTEQSFKDGWFDTGDRAVIDAAGFVTLVGRAKDIIIRGGMKIPVAEIESLLSDHPSVADVALVAVADGRLGERACACVVVRDAAQQPSVETLAEFLLGEGVSKQFLPEHLVILDSLPRTMSGKIRKVELRGYVAESLGGGPA